MTSECLNLGPLSVVRLFGWDLASSFKPALTPKPSHEAPSDHRLPAFAGWPEARRGAPAMVCFGLLDFVVCDGFCGRGCLDDLCDITHVYVISNWRLVAPHNHPGNQP